MASTVVYFREEADGVHNSLAIVENIVEFRPAVCRDAAQEKRYVRIYAEMISIFWNFTGTGTLQKSADHMHIFFVYTEKYEYLSSADSLREQSWCIRYRHWALAFISCNADPQSYHKRIWIQYK